MQKNPSSSLGNVYTNQKSGSHHKGEENSSGHNNHSTIEGLSKDQLNESSNYLSEDPLMKSNQQLQNVAVAANSSKTKHFN